MVYEQNEISRKDEASENEPLQEEEQMQILLKTGWNEVRNTCESVPGLVARECQDEGVWHLQSHFEKHLSSKEQDHDRQEQS